MASTLPTDNHGLVRPWERGRSFELHHQLPSPSLAHIIDRYWIARWDLRGRDAFRQETLPHPSINLVFEPDEAWIWGVPMKRDVRMLKGKSWAIGAKFRPGGFTACTGTEASRLTDDRVAAKAALPVIVGSIGSVVRDPQCGSLDSILAGLDAVFMPLAGVEDPALELVGNIITRMRDLAPDARVSEIAAAQYLSPRTLQRLFQRYVGVNPKWVLKRLRVHDAIGELSAGAPMDWTELALRLGYYDHAHMIRDFRLVVGRSPAAYAAEATSAHL